MVHDPMCPIEWLHGTGPSGFTKVPCQCDLIATVRAAQSEADAQIVEAQERYCVPATTNQNCLCPWINYEDAATAIRAGK